MLHSTEMNNILLWIDLSKLIISCVLFTLAALFCCSALPYRDRLGVSWSYSTWCFNGMSGRIASNRGNLLGSLITSFRSPTSTGRFIDLQKHSDKTNTAKQRTNKKLYKFVLSLYKLLLLCTWLHYLHVLSSYPKRYLCRYWFDESKIAPGKQTFCK